MIEFLTTPLPLSDVLDLEALVDNWIFVASLAFLGFELVRYLLRKRMNWNLGGDTLANFVTFGFFILLAYGALGVAYVATYYAASSWAIFSIETTPIAVIICVVLADLAYYWEHRFTHRVNIAWATHTVHHSSPHYNISVAYRFGPMDGVWPLFFHVPLVLLGFHPLLVLAAEAFVQAYQTFLHTEAIGKFPRPVEAVMNTPSHHRVHHGSNEEYIDRNYGGIFIIWDRLFGTHAREEAPVDYGLTKPINSVNPLTIWFHGFLRLGREFLDARGARGKLNALLGPPAGDESPNVHPKSAEVSQ